MNDKTLFPLLVGELLSGFRCFSIDVPVEKALHTSSNLKCIPFRNKIILTCIRFNYSCRICADGIHASTKRYAILALNHMLDFFFFKTADGSISFGNNTGLAYKRNHIYIFFSDKLFYADLHALMSTYI